MITTTILNTAHPDYTIYERMIVNSAQWAAAGDALGWMTELATNLSNIKYRTGSEKVSQTVHWKRNINGRHGPNVNLPAGTYSDDTQLRLSVCRAIRGNGTFDVEAFAKIELTVWLAYALGGGTGTKNAATNLSRKGATWFSNFFEKGNSKYIYGGGNGAAMRIQPHVWSCQSIDSMLLNILRDSLVTHGHPHGFCGAIFHGLCLYQTLTTKKIPDINSWRAITEYFLEIPAILERDYQLASFWLPTWEKKTGQTLKEAVALTYEEMNKDISLIETLFHTKLSISYSEILETLECKSDKYRGSGLKTALAASTFSFFSQESKIEDILTIVANELHSDTDTIATMIGALLGTLESRLPTWEIQDRDYITAEALRLARISTGHNNQASFVYPDPAKWASPSSQASAVIMTDKGLSISGLGELKILGEKYDHGNYSWQWFTLPFGQTILTKFKQNIDATALSINDLHQDNTFYPEKSISLQNANISPPLKTFVQQKVASSPYQGSENDYLRDSTNLRNVETIDDMTNNVISSNFDEKLFGYYFNKIVDECASLEQAIAFCAIIAKAKLVRNRKKNSRT